MLVRDAENVIERDAAGQHERGEQPERPTGLHLVPPPVRRVRDHPRPGGAPRARIPGRLIVFVWPCDGHALRPSSRGMPGGAEAAPEQRLPLVFRGASYATAAPCARWRGGAVEVSAEEALVRVSLSR